MRQNLVGILWRLAIFISVALLCLFVLVAVYGDLRFTPAATIYNAVFNNVSGLKNGNPVRIAGIEVGKVRKITVRDDATVNVEFSIDKAVVLTHGTRAVIKYENLIGERYLALEEGDPGKTLAAGQTIPLSRTQPALDLNALIGGLRPLFRALDPDQINGLTSQLVAAFQGEGATISGLLSQSAAVTNTLADRDQLIGQAIVNLNMVLGSLGGQTQQFDKAVDSLSQLVASLAERKIDITNGVARINAVAGSVSNLLSRARAPLNNTIHQFDRSSEILDADHDYLDSLLNTLPDKYAMLGRQALYGGFFSFYLCDLVLKLNGKGGQPVYIKLAGQDSGRCSPK